MKPEDWITVRKRDPDIGDFVLALAKGGAYSVQIVSCDFGDRFDFWMPLVPPPKPDPFETWWWAKVNTSAWGNDVKEVCRRAWDAAIKSKEQCE